MHVPDSMREVQQTLAELAALESASDFWCEFRALVATRLSRLGPEAQTLTECYAAFLAGELHQRTRPGNFASTPGVEEGEPGSDRETGAVGAWLLLQAVKKARPDTDAARIAHRLILADACCHMGAFGSAAAHLSAAREAGAAEPILFLAGGCCICAEAALEHAGPACGTNAREVAEPLRYRRALLEAVTVFEQGIAGGPLDGCLCSWMEVALAEAGFCEAARVARSLSEASGPRVTTATWDQWLTPGNARRRESKAWSDELRQVARALQRTYTQAEVLGGGSGP